MQTKGGFSGLVIVPLLLNMRTGRNLRILDNIDFQTLWNDDGYQIKMDGAIVYYRTIIVNVTTKFGSESQFEPIDLSFGEK